MAALVLLLLSTHIFTSVLLTTQLSTLEADGWELDDGEAIAKAHPVTFWIPPLEQRQSLKTGAIVKLLFRIETREGDAESAVERMWVRVEERSGPHYLGTLDNDPVEDSALKCGARVVFEARHVIDIWEDA